MVEPGYLRPKTKQTIPVDIMDAILDICPGVSIDGAGVEQTPLHDPVMGPGVSVWRGRAVRDEVQFRAAAGGALTALGMYLVDSGEVKFVLHVTAAKNAPMLTERKLSFDAGEVLEGAASRYGPAAPLVDVSQLLDRNEPFAFIGKPCDVAAVRNLARHDARAAKLVKYTLTLSCAGVPALGFSTQFLERHGMKEPDLSEFRYRGFGWPGPTYARTAEGREAEEPYLDMWYPYNEKWKTQFRCKICPDATGELADITSVDDWPTGFPENDERIGPLSGCRQNQRRRPAGTQRHRGRISADGTGAGKDVGDASDPTPSSEQEAWHPRASRGDVACRSRPAAISQHESAGERLDHSPRVPLSQLLGAQKTAAAESTPGAGSAIADGRALRWTSPPRHAVGNL